MDGSMHLADEKIKEFLREDVGYGDITSAALVPMDQRAAAHLYYREPGVASGLEEAALVFTVLGCVARQLVPDGSRVEAEQTLLEVRGPARALLTGERTALNIVCRMAGIASQTAEAVRRAASVNPLVRVAATRKTAPGLRDLDKKAVEHGGGDPHRFRLDDCVLIKDNHLELVPSITEAVQRARRLVSFTKKIEVEVRTLAEAEEAARAGAEIIMFDNMPPKAIKETLGSLDERGLREGRVFEASGGVTLDNIAEYAASGVDVISLGSLTHSVRSLDVKLEIEMM
ncbi:nicotinate-nucleotide diphosphorylase (carboxylating) [Candidatus Bathyarchaeota archaeon RBG_16_57_9]|nr:MAG: nicotinate-nucleotide diphosphorylase (carboxylating) [Candidatus Bathyarchaeota archaeon RBG_16_57_9]OGD54590.1 MAG: nicotinate-nucleotide diphosphorylase (carboxylating) [Candidatus Bathyarchaeota archaeon RBG_13_60_20]